MTEAMDKTYTPLEHYDNTIHLNHSMYDNMPYIRDTSLCNRESVGKASGNVYKFFSYSLNDTYKIGGD